MSSVAADASGDLAESEPRAPSAEAVWRDVVAGRLVVLRHRDADGRRYLYLQPVGRTPGEEDHELTERERLVVGYRAYGQGLKHIASELGVSVPTVTRCLARALAKLGLDNDMQLPAVFGVGFRGRRGG